MSEAPDRLRYRIRTDDDGAHLGLDVAVVDARKPTELFPTFDEIVRFFERGGLRVLLLLAWRSPRGDATPESDVADDFARGS